MPRRDERPQDPRSWGLYIACPPGDGLAPYDNRPPPACSVPLDDADAVEAGSPHRLLDVMSLLVARALTRIRRSPDVAGHHDAVQDEQGAEAHPDPAADYGGLPS